MNTQEEEAAAASQLRIENIPGQAIKVITNPVGFYQGMAKSGGLLAIIMVPIFVVIFGIIAAAIAYGIWKLLGSAEDFETAFRCVAYAAAIAAGNFSAKPDSISWVAYRCPLADGPVGSGQHSCPSP